MPEIIILIKPLDANLSMLHRKLSSSIGKLILVSVIKLLRETG